MTTTDLSALPDGASQPPTMMATTKETAAEDRPDYERSALSRMRDQWRLPDLLLSKTEGMQKAGVDVLPQEVDETPEEYDRRRKCTALTNYYGNTLESHTGMPFGKVLQFDPPLPDQLAYLHKDADGTGRSITVLARDMLREGVHRGLTHVIVDIPRGRTESYAEVQARQPRIIHIPPGDLLDVREQPSEAGDVVSYARIRRTRETAKGAYGSATESTIVEIDAEQKESIEWVKQSDGQWLASEPERYTRDAIPLFTFYAKHVGPFEGEPAYSHLAELNLAHYQVDADYRMCLANTMRGTLVLTGWPIESAPASVLSKGKTPTSTRFTLGWRRVLRHENADANARMMETGGAPAAVGRDALADLENRMERFGAAQVSQGGGITATGRELDNRRDTCNMEAWCTRLEAVLLDALRAAAAWRKVELPADQKVLITREWASDGPKKEHVPQLLALASAGFLSRETMIREVQARGILATVADATEEIERIRAQAEQDVEASMQSMAERMLQERGQAAAEPTGEQPPADAGGFDVTLNELTLGVERLKRAGNVEGANALLRLLAKELEVPSMGKVTKQPEPVAP